MITTLGFLGLSPQAAFLFLSLIILVVAFEIIMFISVFLNKRISTRARTLWIVGMLLLHPFVAIAYFVAVFNKPQS